MRAPIAQVACERKCRIVLGGRARTAPCAYRSGSVNSLTTGESTSSNPNHLKATVLMQRQLIRLVTGSILAICWILISAPALGAASPEHVAEAPDNEATPVLFPDGSIRIYYVEPTERQAIRSIGSSDHGKTWGDDRHEFALPGTGYHGNQVMLDNQGTLHAVAIIRAQGPRGRQWNLWYNRRARDGEWGEPQMIYEGYIGALRSFQQLPSGRLLLPVHVFTHYDPRPAELLATGVNYGQGDCIVLYSDNYGQTWERSQSRLSIPQDARRAMNGYGACEPIVTRLQDGRLWMLMRNKNGHLWESFSADEGVTWSEALPTAFIASDSPAATVRLRDGRLAIFLNSCQRWDNLRAYAAGGREVLHAAISSDDGKTWRGFREVLRQPTRGQNAGDRGTAYPSAIATHDGRILLVTGQGFAKSIIRIDPGWLEEASAKDDFSDGLAQWTSYGGVGVSAMENPDEAGSQVLSIRPVNGRGLPAAVWNFPASLRGELTMRLKLDEGFQGATIALTDHFNVAADTKAAEHAVAQLTISATGEIQRNVKLTPGQWHDLGLTWDVSRRVVAIAIDGKAVGHFMLDHPTDVGINYLRLLMTGEPGSGALMLDSVRTDETAQNL